MNKNELSKILLSLRGGKVLVVGDLMLDRYIFGIVDRISPEAPVPVVLIEKETFVPGGAGNVAINIAALGGKVSILGVIGKDNAAGRLIKEFKKRNIDASAVIKTASKPTVQKIRVVAHGQQLIRLDIEKTEKIGAQLEKSVIKILAEKIKNSDAVAVSDYAKGFITKNLVGKIIYFSKKYKKPIVGDIKPKNFSYFKNIDIIAPNEKEALEMSGKNLISEAGKFLQNKLNCDVLITRGAKGLALFEKNKRYDFPAEAKDVFSVTGAGDTVTAVIALCLAADIKLQNAALIANCAAGIVVGKMGTTAPSFSELLNSLEIQEKTK